MLFLACPSVEFCQAGFPDEVKISLLGCGPDHHAVHLSFRNCLQAEDSNSKASTNKYLATHSQQQLAQIRPQSSASRLCAGARSTHSTQRLKCQKNIQQRKGPQIPANCSKGLVPMKNCTEPHNSGAGLKVKP